MSIWWILLIFIIIAISIAILLYVIYPRLSPSDNNINRQQTIAGMGQVCTTTTICGSNIVHAPSNANNTGICKQPLGGACTILNDCNTSGSSGANACQITGTETVGVCTQINVGILNGACPCNDNLVCSTFPTGNVCKLAPGQVCSLNSQCSVGICDNGLSDQCLADKGQSCVVNSNCVSNNCGLLPIAYTWDIGNEWNPTTNNNVFPDNIVVDWIQTRFVSDTQTETWIINNNGLYFSIYNRNNNSFGSWSFILPLQNMISEVIQTVISRSLFVESNGTVWIAAHNQGTQTWDGLYQLVIQQDGSGMLEPYNTTIGQLPGEQFYNGQSIRINSISISTENDVLLTGTVAN